MRMRDIWTEGSSARKRGWYDPPLNTGRANYHPSQRERKNQQSVTVEYIQTPEYYALNHPVKHAINTHTQAAVEKTVKICHAIPTARISEINQGMVLATKWINFAIIAIVALCALTELIWIVFTPPNIMVEYIWMCGYNTAIACTVCILLYRYHKILDKRFDRVGSLHKRANITRSTKITIFMLLKTLGLLYWIIIPYIAKIALAIF